LTGAPASSSEERIYPFVQDRCGTVETDDKSDGREADQCGIVELDDRNDSEKVSCTSSSARLCPNNHVVSTIIASLDGMDMDIGDMDSGNEGMIMEVHLDSHANMVVLGKGCRVIAVSEYTAEVSAYTDDVGKLHQVPIVDAVLMYRCPHNQTQYLLVVRNDLYVLSMKHHLIPPFVMREGGVEVNDVPKFQVAPIKRGLEDHSLYFEKSRLRIHLKLEGIFSYFETTQTQQAWASGDTN
jgi:hypothetical protein